MATYFPTKWAILLGPKDYHNIPPLKYSTADVIDVASVFRKDLGFKDESVFEFGTALSLEPFRHVFYDQVGKLQTSGKVQPDDLLVFYFSGHGIRDKKDYLLPVEASPDNLKRTGIEFEDLVEQLTELNCKNVVMFLDMCREPIQPAIRGRKGVISIGMESRQIVENADFAAIFSCGPEQLSYEIEELKHGSFTHCFLKAIKDGNCNTLADMYQFLLKELPFTNRQNHKPEQSPYPVQAGDKWNLPIFSSGVQLTEFARRLDGLIQKLQDLHEKGMLPFKYFEATVEFLDIAKEGQLTAADKDKLNLIERLCAGKSKVTAFIPIWDSTERRRLVAASEVGARPELAQLQ